MQVALFVPCYVDQLYPQVAMSTLRVLERLDIDVVFPESQTCCGQPMANTGCWDDALPLAEHFLKTFADYEYVVAPSGSCVAMVRHHYETLLAGKPGFEELKNKTFEFTEFMVDVLKVDSLPGSFTQQVGLHQSCHGLRELRMGSCSEIVGPKFSKPRQVLSLLQDIHFSELKRNDECCGFGGTFAVAEEAVSCMMGQDRIADHLESGTEVLTAADMSCLMHLQGIIRREKHPIKVMHVAEILDAASSSPAVESATKSEAQV